MPSTKKAKTDQPKKKEWRNSAARVVLLRDLESGVLPLDTESMPAKEAWEKYKDLAEFEGIPYEQFRDRLRDHRRQILKKKEGGDESKPKKKKKTWAKSAARLMIIDDLESGALPLDKGKMSAQDAWDVLYKDLPEFKEVPFEKFQDRLRDHRKQVKKLRVHSEMEYAAFLHDRQLYPRKEKNSKGEPVFDMSDAKELLRDDIKCGMHHLMSPAELYKSREEYQLFAATKFKERIYQEVRRTKFINWMNKKRENKRKTEW